MLNSKYPIRLILQNGLLNKPGISIRYALTKKRIGICSDPIKLAQTAVAFFATVVFIMLQRNVIDNSQG
jgi:hypothetical protein